MVALEPTTCCGVALPTVAEVAATMSVTIRSRLLLLVLALLVPGLLGVGWLITRTFEAERAAHERTLRETTRALAMVVDGELTQRATIARLLAQSRNLDTAPLLTAEQLHLFDQQARRALQGMDGWVELRSASGLVLDTRLPSGENPASPDPADAAAAARELASLNDRSTVWPLQRADQPALAHAAVVEPVLRNGSAPLMSLKVTLRPAELQRIIDRQRLPPDWIGALVDSRGQVVARHPGGSAYMGRGATPDLMAAVARSSEGLVELVSLDGRRTTAYFNTSPRGWTYVTAMPREQFAGVLPSAVRQVALASLLLLLALAVLGALWLARRIAAPVHALKHAAAQLQAGKPVAYRATGIVECDEVAAALSEAAQAVQRGRSELELKVSEAVERTRQAEQRISQSQRVEALGRLTGGVAHDFNNLLGVISNSAHLIQRHATTPELQVPVAATLRAVEVGSRLTQHLLRFAGRRPVRPQALELGRYLPELQELMRSVLGRHVEISVQVAPDTHTVQIDSGELELALINLALNARDAMANGGQLRLRARNASADDTDGLPPGRYVLITVSDDGAGMEADLAERVFEPFFTTKAVGKGTGLGLSQVHGFCVQAGGTARLASTPGVGTTVSLLLPAGNGLVAASGAAPGASPASTSSEPGLRGVRVLLVEDNAELGDVTAALLQSHGATVLRADDAGQALARLETGEGVDIVLSDVVMPGPLDGLQLARKLRKERPELPVLLISGYIAQRPAVRDFQVLSKPCSQDDLLAALRSALAAARAMPSLEQR
jgi:signal transduction histidine kinase